MKDKRGFAPIITALICVVVFVGLALTGLALMNYYNPAVNVPEGKDYTDAIGYVMLTDTMYYYGGSFHSVPEGYAGSLEMDDEGVKYYKGVPDVSLFKIPNFSSDDSPGYYMIAGINYPDTTFVTQSCRLNTDGDGVTDIEYNPFCFFEEGTHYFDATLVKIDENGQKTVIFHDSGSIQITLEMFE